MADGGVADGGVADGGVADGGVADVDHVRREFGEGRRDDIRGSVAVAWSLHYAGVDLDRLMGRVRLDRLVG